MLKKVSVEIKGLIVAIWDGGLLVFDFKGAGIIKCPPRYIYINESYLEFLYKSISLITSDCSV